MHERLETIISGRVQLVMYRDFAQRKARRLKLVGEVQNLPNGTVRVIAEGPREHLETYLVLLHKGPLLAHVDAVMPVWKEAQGAYTEFSINYD